MLAQRYCSFLRLLEFFDAFLESCELILVVFARLLQVLLYDLVLGFLLTLALVVPLRQFFDG